MRVVVVWVLLIEGKFDFWYLQLAFSILIREVFYVHRLARVPSTYVASLPTSKESFCYSIERIAHDFVILSFGCLFFALLGLEIPMSSRPSDLDFSDP